MTCDNCGKTYQTDVANSFQEFGLCSEGCFMAYRRADMISFYNNFCAMAKDGEFRKSVYGNRSRSYASHIGGR